MENQTLSVCLIVKNEEKFLSKCLESIKKFADEIVVVDTGSTDKTKEIAKVYGVKLIDHKWNNDFSEVRNVSIEYATKDWILFIDADEEVPEDDGKAIKILINDPKNADFEGYYLRLVNIVDNKEVGDAIVFRLYKNRPQYRFVGKMHEQIINSVQGNKGPNSIGSTKIRILHYGYDPSLSDQREKGERNINLLLSYEQKDKDGYYYYSLGNEYTRRNDFENAIKCYDKAIIMAEIDTGKMPIYYSYLISALLKLLYSLKKYKLTFKYSEKFKKDCPDFKDIYFMEALAYIEISSFSKGKKALLKYLECERNSSTYTYPSNNFEEYNIGELLSKLDVATVKHEPNLISSIVIYDNENVKILETIKSLNEISKEVFVVATIGVNQYFDAINNMGIQIIKSKTISEDEMFYLAAKQCTGKFILKLNCGEIFSAVSQKELVKILTFNISEAYKVDIVDEQGNFIRKELRVIRNNRKFNNLKMFKNLLNVSKPNDISLQIHNFNLISEAGDDILEGIEEFENNKILIGAILNSSKEENKNFLKSVTKLNNQNLILDYYFQCNLSSNDIEEDVELLLEDSENVIIKEINKDVSTDIYIYEILDFAQQEQYDYLLFVDSLVYLDKNIIYELLTLKSDIGIKKYDNKVKIIMISRDGVLRGMAPLPIKRLNNDDLELNLLVRCEVLGLTVKYI